MDLTPSLVVADYLAGNGKTLFLWRAWLSF